MGPATTNRGSKSFRINDLQAAYLCSALDNYTLYDMKLFDPSKRSHVKCKDYTVDTFTLFGKVAVEA